MKTEVILGGSDLSCLINSLVKATECTKDSILVMLPSIFKDVYNTRVIIRDMNRNRDFLMKSDTTLGQLIESATASRPTMLAKPIINYYGIEHLTTMIEANKVLMS